MNIAKWHSLRAWVVCLSVATASADGTIDSVLCGEPSSETAHGLVSEKSQTGAWREGRTGRRCSEEGFFAYRLIVQPDELNYLTFCVDGDEVGALPGGRVAFGIQGVRRGHRIKVEGIPLLERKETIAMPLSPSRWEFFTYPLTEQMTQGKRHITVRVESLPGCDTRAFYGLWSHPDPGAALALEAKGHRKPIADNEKVDVPLAYSVLARRIDDIVDELKSCQWYGPDWDALAQKHPEISKLHGAMSFSPFRPPRSVDVKRMADSAIYQDWMLWGIEAFAWAYLTKASRHHGDMDLMMRAVAALDFLTRAQGSNGGLEDFSDRPRGWFGGPERKPGVGCHEGFVTIGPGRAFLALLPKLRERELLAIPIDSDGDGRSDSPRAEAYGRMFKMWLERVFGDPLSHGHAPNQDAGVLLGAQVWNECHRALTGADAVSSEQVAQYEAEVLGPRPPWHLSPSGGKDYARRFNYEHWFTPKGMLMEGRTIYQGAGYDGSYGLLTLELITDYARRTGSSVAREQVLRYLNAWQHFIDPARLDRGICLSNGLEWRTGRRTYSEPRSANIHAGAFADAALLGSESAKRMLQIFLTRFEDEDITGPDDNFHGDHRKSIGSLIPFAELLREWLGRGITVIELRDALQLPEEIRTDCRMPMERERFVWTDEVARHAVVKDGPRRLFVALDWWDSRSTPRTAKFHYYDDVRDVIGIMAQSFDAGLYDIRVGPFRILMNSSTERREVSVSHPHAGKWLQLPYAKLLQENRIPLESQSSVILVVQ